MKRIYDRDLDLNLLRVLLVVADQGSVTEAASVLYVTQPAISAALKRLQTALDAELFVREGRGIALTARGRALVTQIRPHVEALVDAARTAGGFEPATSERVVRLGLADAMEHWLLPDLLGRLRASAPLMSLVVLPVQFRNVGARLAHGDVDIAVTVADDLPSTVCRENLFHATVIAVFDPRHHDVGEVFEREAYLAAEHVIVSYNGDRRGLVEDMTGARRDVRLSIASFHAVGDVLDDSPLVATVPERVAATILRARPHLRTAALPFEFAGAWVELLWRRATDDDPALRFVKEQIIACASS